jgi:hypothetical protein
MLFEEAVAIEKSMLFRENIHFHEVSKDSYLAALSITHSDHIGINDALACVLMKKNRDHENLLL